MESENEVVGGPLDAEDTQPADLMPTDILEKKKLLAKLNKMFNSAQEERKKYEQQWYLNLAFYLGHQYVTVIPAKGVVNGSAFNLQDVSVPKWGAKLVANKIQPTIRNELTKLTKEEIQGFVVPNTTDENDLAAARAGEAIAEFMFDALEINRVRSAASLWACINGNGFIKSWVDPQQLDMDGLPNKICIDSVNPSHLYFGDLSVDTIEKQPFIIHAQTLAEEDAEAKFGVELEPDCSEDSNFEQKMQSLLSLPTKPKDKVHVREMWMKPCAKYPAGAIFTFTENVLLSGVEWFYSHGEYPFYKIGHVPVPGRFYSESVVTQMITLQKEYNKTRSQLIENKNRMSRPQLLAAKGSIDPRKVTSEPGLVLEYNLGFPAPTPMVIAQIPSYVLQEQDRILRDMDDVSGQYEITKGRTPPGVEAASAIAYLQEENDSRMHHTISAIELAVKSIGRHILSYVGQYWTEARMVRVISANNSYEAKKFKSSDLRGNLDYRVEAGSMAPRSKAARQAFITELMKMGAIPADRGLKYLQMSETNRLFQELQVDSRQAQRENDKMAEAVPPIVTDEMLAMDPMASVLSPLPVNEFDNHQIHRDEHGRFMKTQEYELLPEENKQSILAHWQQHSQAMQMEMMQQQQQQMLAAGQGAPPTNG